jgi:hypothetical protein
MLVLLLCRIAVRFCRLIELRESAGIDSAGIHQHINFAPSQRQPLSPQTSVPRVPHECESAKAENYKPFAE